jgi:hypothetical protein
MSFLLHQKSKKTGGEILKKIEKKITKQKHIH